MIEEEIFYPALRGKIEDDLLDEAYVEHDGAKVLINDIMAGGPDDEFYDAKVKVLSEEIEHHVKEEEAPSEGMFAQARKTDVDLVALRDQMLARKEELKQQAETSGLPPAQPTVVNPQAGVEHGAATMDAAGAGCRPRPLLFRPPAQVPRDGLVPLARAQAPRVRCESRTRRGRRSPDRFPSR